MSYIIDIDQALENRVELFNDPARFIEIWELISKRQRLQLLVDAHILPPMFAEQLQKAGRKIEERHVSIEGLQEGLYMRLVDTYFKKLVSASHLIHCAARGLGAGSKGITVSELARAEAS